MTSNLLRDVLAFLGGLLPPVMPVVAYAGLMGLLGFFLG